MFGWQQACLVSQFLCHLQRRSSPTSSCGGWAPPCILWLTGGWGTTRWRPSPLPPPSRTFVVVLFQGLSAATAVILGQRAGRRAILKRAEKYATHFFILQFIVTLAVEWRSASAIRGPIIGHLPDHAGGGPGRKPVHPDFCRLYMPAKMFNYVNVVGVLQKRRRYQDVPVP